ncbi:acetyl-CoA C-acetyltransferase [Faecalitalea cylindroides]|uniref:acetyl-CoA C-acetyltransferase n=1 Tax=Faecalitalea cylindroides TaxID=39483 RepID=UPI000B37CEA7|nr:acetyl-CoA C-acetyltransferase [Faecalitalea cylindroides]MDB7946037.1 acetyl-CoA C-acetyltransferase [Faecalitalea cylindroides]MDB7947829.1 acetyl-CoA C-acetyltransferase [Faecalitalea cylindroides]MDB7949706.1 acetyl-CoA C-acetyltransferase [Faecalitalea cylindroides]OUN63753.1 acetyl-CoA acetyltransferase [Faecalitalea cylindroides]
MRKAYIVAAKRSAIGTFMGSLTDVDVADMGATVLKETIKQANIDPANLDEVIIGNVIAAGLGQNIARNVAFKAGIPVEVCAQSINMLCGSGLKAVMEATLRIQANFGDLYVAGGVESMTRAPFLLSYKNRKGVKSGDMTVVDSMLHDGLTDAMYGIHMGVTADNIAKKYNISREAQDEFALASQQKALAAIESGRFKDEIVPITYSTRKGEVVFDTDEHPRQTSMEKLAKLRPAFTKDGTVTAGNASGINDGASFTIIASEDAVKKYNLKPICEVVGFGQGGVDPRVMGLGPTPAILNALKYADLKIEDMELVELNEAFAAQSLGVIHELEEATGMNREEFLKKTNVNGGAIALGHPVGASGNRILVTLIHEMQKRNLTTGLASLCIGGGQGAAVIIKMCK